METDEIHHVEEEPRKKKKKHRYFRESNKESQLEDGEIPSENDEDGGVKKKSKKKKKNEPDKEKKSKKRKESHSKGFYNLDDYDKPDTERRRRKSVSPLGRTGLGYRVVESSSSSNSTNHRHEDHYSDSHHRHHHYSHRSDSHRSDSHRSRSSHSHEKERKRRRSRSRSQSVVERVDKEKLLQIAKANLARMIKAGTLPKGVDIDKPNLEQLKNLKDKNSISQWSEYCRALSVMEAATHEDSADSDLYEESDDDNSDTKSVCSAIVRHPFQLKERKDIQIKVKDFSALPTRSSKEIQKELTEKFPVSFGDGHRMKELEWVEVKPSMPPPSEIPKKKETDKRVFKEFKEPKETPVEDHIDSSVSSSTPDSELNAPSTSSEIGTLVALRLSAKKKLQVDPMNLTALRQMYEAERLLTQKMQEQALHNEQTAIAAGTYSPSINSNSHFVRAGIEHFSELNRIKDGIGMHLLLKMGWQPGQGLGKNLTGIADPIVPNLKFDTKGLFSEEETVSKIPAQVVDMSISDGRNPVSFLHEHCAKNKWALPVYDLVEAEGPDHKKSFIMKCIVNTVEYRPSVSCGTKKQAKALAATVALQALGLNAGE